MRSPEFQPSWRLELELDDHGRKRTVSLDFQAREELDRQLVQLNDLENAAFGRLLEFTNENGESLAVVAAIYARHRITRL
jgi:hypothetical protein